MAKEKNRTLKEAGIEMNYLTGDEEVRRLVELREKWEMDWNSGMANAKEEGIRQRNIEIVKDMHKNNLPLELIIKISKLTKEEVEKILKDNE